MIRTLTVRPAVWVTAGLALGGVALAGGAQALSGGAARPAGASVAAPAHPTSSPTSRLTVVMGSSRHGEGAPAGTPGTAGKGDPDGLARPDGRGRFCVHLTAQALAAIAAAKRLPDGGVDLPLSALRLSRCVPTPMPKPVPHAPGGPLPTVHPLPSMTPVPVTPRPRYPWPPLPEQPAPIRTLAAPGPATTR